MLRLNRITIAALLTTGIAGGTYAFLGSPLVPAAEARLKDHPRLEAAAAALKDARDYIEHTESDFHGHKVEALRSIHEALHEVALAAGEHDRSASQVPPIPLDHHRHQKLWEAREHLKEAREYLHTSRAEFYGHKEAAMKWIDETIHHIDAMLVD